MWASVFPSGRSLGVPVAVSIRIRAESQQQLTCTHREMGSVLISRPHHYFHLGCWLPLPRSGPEGPSHVLSSRLQSSLPQSLPVASGWFSSWDRGQPGTRFPIPATSIIWSPSYLFDICLFVCLFIPGLIK